MMAKIQFINIIHYSFEDNYRCNKYYGINVIESLLLRWSFRVENNNIWLNYNDNYTHVS